MILVVCPNPALDVTYTVERLVPGESHLVRTFVERAGGKGVNVVRVLAQLRATVTVTGFLGGARGARLHDELAGCALAQRWVDVREQSRRTVTVVDPHGATVMREPGPQIAPADWDALVERVRTLGPGTDVAVLAGSLPPGAPADGYATLVSVLDALDVPAVLDATGSALAAALPARPFLVKPNAAEAAEIVGAAGDPVATLLVDGARNAVVSDGAAGVTAAVAGRRYRAVPPALAGNPTGGGDALAAGLAAGIAAGAPAEALLRRAVALAASAVTLPHAGEVDRALAEQLCPRVLVTGEDQ